MLITTAAVNHHPKPIALHSGKNTQKHTNFKPFAEPLEQIKSGKNWSVNSQYFREPY